MRRQCQPGLIHSTRLTNWQTDSGGRAAVAVNGGVAATVIRQEKATVKAGNYGFLPLHHIHLDDDSNSQQNPQDIHVNKSEIKSCINFK